MRAHFREEQLQAHAPRLPFDALVELLPEDDWISPKEAAAAVRMTPNAFRAAYCAPEAPRLRIWQRRGPHGGRRLLVNREDVAQLIREGLLVPA
ncbi:hypothetical protein [Geothrix fuzhouensis]|uniref:hypothetical protein n=1 Tax=Geothrix fuzhouensis TaxID=2966451 RepID=UPI0021493F08|nr:hypothetical protein [Geothrix fuzhouensis]